MDAWNEDLFYVCATGDPPHVCVCCEAEFRLLMTNEKHSDVLARDEPGRRRFNSAECVSTKQTLRRGNKLKRSCFISSAKNCLGRK